LVTKSIMDTSSTTESNLSRKKADDQAEEGEEDARSVRRRKFSGQHRTDATSAAPTGSVRVRLADDSVDRVEIEFVDEKSMQKDQGHQ